MVLSLTMCSTWGFVHAASFSETRGTRGGFADLDQVKMLLPWSGARARRHSPFRPRAPEAKYPILSCPSRRRSVAPKATEGKQRACVEACWHDCTKNDGLWFGLGRAPTRSSTQKRAKLTQCGLRRRHMYTPPV